MIRDRAGRKANSALRLLATLKQQVILSLPAASNLTSLSYASAASAMALLLEYELVEEITGNRRNRRFAYRPYLAILSEGTEAL